MPGWCYRSRPGFPRGRRSFWWQVRSTSARSCSATSAASSDKCSRAAISRRSAVDLTNVRTGTLAMRGKRFFLLWSIGLALAIASTPLRAQASQNPIKVVASFSILGDFVKNVGGNRVDGTTLVGVDGDGHVFTPAPADARKISDADLLVINGLGLEGWLPRLLQGSSARAPIVTASQGIAPLKFGSEADPHAWQSVANAKSYVANIRDALIAAAPADAESFRKNAESYLAKLDALDREVRRAVAQLPPGRPKVISTHD